MLWPIKGNVPQLRQLKWSGQDIGLDLFGTTINNAYP